MLRRLGIRAKVLAVLAVPMLVLVLLGVYISVAAFDDLDEARATQSVAETLRAYQPLGQAIDNEYIVAMTSRDPDQIAATQQATDQALASVRKYTAKLPLDRFPPALVAQFSSVQADYETTLPSARQAVARGGVNSVVRANFQTIEKGQLELVAQLTENFPNREVASAVTGYHDLSQTSTNLVAELIQGSSLLAGTASPSLGAVYQDTIDATESARTAAAVSLNRMSGIELTLPSGQPSSQFIAQRALLATGDLESIRQVDPAVYAGQIETQTTALVELAGQAIDHAQQLADEDSAAALQRFYVTIGATLVAAVLSFLLALFVARTIVTPLRRLTSAASDVRERLPQIVEQVATPGEQPDIQLDPIPVRAQDEVGRLAQAFNSMNATTLRVAQEQAALRGSIAEMFVNVARRDQVLLNRQLSFIDSLERSEEDPNTLANLFRLDHLATRMRRNAESLLVLAGIDSGRRLRDSMPLSDVIRTASSEIEQYDRVELDLQIDPHMLGFNALPAAHLLAELLENATVFSEPETPVTVTTGVSGQFVVVRIRDHGLGMTPEEIEAANAKIVSSGAGDALGAQRLGLFVVGRIAQKLGAAVHLAKADSGTGTDTTVLLPASLFATTESSGFGVPSMAEQVAHDAAVAPEVAPVDLSALTDGSTALGLPRRRRGEGEPVADSAPIPVAGVTPVPEGRELPTRPRKTFDEDAIVLPEVATPTLSPDLSSAAPDWAPATMQATSSSGLPSRAARGAAPATPAWEPTPPPAAPAEESGVPSPAARAGLFSGFRGRTSLTEGYDPSNDQVRAPWMSLGTHAAAAEAPAEPVADETPWTPDAVGAVPGLAPDEDEVQDPHDEPGQDTPHDEPAAADVPAWAVEQPAVEAVQPVEQPAAYEPVSFEPGAPLAGAEPEPAPYEAEQVPVPTWDDVPVVHAEPVEQPAAVGADESFGVEPFEPVAYEPASFEPVTAWDQAVTEAVADEAQHASYEQPVHETYEQAPQTESYEPAAAWSAPVVDEPVAEQPSQPVVDAPAAFAGPDAAPRQEPPIEYTSYSGYSGWSTARRAVAANQSFDFERSLDEARAWHTGAQPTVSAAELAAAAVADTSVPDRVEPAAEPTFAAFDAPVEQVVEAAEPEQWQPTFAPSAQSDLATEAAVAEAAAEPEPWQPVFAPSAEDAVPDEAAPVAEQAVEPEQWQPTFQAPAWDAPQPAEVEPELAGAVEEAFAVPALADDEPTAALEPVVEPVAQEAGDGGPVWAETAPAWGAPAWPSLGEQPAAEVAAPEAYAPSAPEAYAPAVAEPYTPAEPAPVAEAPVAAAPVAQGWAPSAGFGAASVDDLAPSGASEDKGGKKRWGLFGRRKGEQVEAAVQPEQVAAAPVAPAAPSWSVPAPVEQPAPAPVRQTSWSAPEPPHPVAPAAPVSSSPAPAAWAPPEWAASRPAAPVATVDVPSPAVPPSTAPRIGTLDDNVAAMLALRSDIQEQALSELSQLSAYRPSQAGSGERLTKRVPTAMPPVAADLNGDHAPVQRDANELRSRLSSFQSGTSRGRQAAGDQPRSS